MKNDDAVLQAALPELRKLEKYISRLGQSEKGLKRIEMWKQALRNHRELIELLERLTDDD